MRFDFHVHALIAKYIPFETDQLNRMITIARKRGLNGFAVVDHIHYPGYWRTSDIFKESFQYHNGIYEVTEDFHIISGAEVHIKGGGHILVLGDIGEIHRIDEEMNLSGGYRPTLEQLLANTPSEMICIGAHPFRSNCGLTEFKPSQLKSLSALELNASDYQNIEQVKRFIKNCKMPMVSGSDAHVWPLIGVSYTILPDDLPNLTKIKIALGQGLTRVEIDPDAAFKVNWCNRLKVSIKEWLYQPPLIGQSSNSIMEY